MDSPNDPEEIRRRVKAARAIAGLSVPGLARRINQRGLGDRTLRDLEAPKGRAIKEMELQAIARACSLPYEWFTVDFDRLPEIAPIGGDVARERALLDAAGGNISGAALRELASLVREQLANEGLPAPPGELGRDAQDSPHTDEHPHRPGHPEAEDG